MKPKLPALALALMASVAAAALPTPLATNATEAVSAETLAALNGGEASCGFSVRFDKLPSRGEPTGLFGLSADKEGYLTITMPAAPDDLVGDMSWKSKKPVEKGKWHHVSFTFSRQMRRFAFYLDGELQVENNTQWLPALGFRSHVPEAFAGAVKNFAMYDISLTSDYLRPADNLDHDLAKAEKLAAAAQKCRGAVLREWAGKIAARIAQLRKAKDSATEREVFEAVRDASNAARLGAAIDALP